MKDMANIHKDAWEKNIKETEGKIQKFLNNLPLPNCDCEDCCDKRKQQQQQQK